MRYVFRSRRLVTGLAAALLAVALSSAFNAIAFFAVSASLGGGATEPLLRTAAWFYALAGTCAAVAFAAGAWERLTEGTWLELAVWQGGCALGSLLVAVGALVLATSSTLSGGNSLVAAGLSLVAALCLASVLRGVATRASGGSAPSSQVPDPSLDYEEREQLLAAGVLICFVVHALVPSPMVGNTTAATVGAVFAAVGLGALGVIFAAMRPASSARQFGAAASLVGGLGYLGLAIAFPLVLTVNSTLTDLRIGLGLPPVLIAIGAAAAAYAVLLTIPHLPPLPAEPRRAGPPVPGTPGGAVPGPFWGVPPSGGFPITGAPVAPGETPTSGAPASAVPGPSWGVPTSGSLPTSGYAASGATSGGATRYCIQCGHVLPEVARFCAQCGAPQP